MNGCHAREELPSQFPPTTKQNKKRLRRAGKVRKPNKTGCGCPSSLRQTSTLNKQNTQQAQSNYNDINVTFFSNNANKRSLIKQKQPQKTSHNITICEGNAHTHRCGVLSAVKKQNSPDWQFGTACTASSSWLEQTQQGDRTSLSYETVCSGFNCVTQY